MFNALEMPKFITQFSFYRVKIIIYAKFLLSIVMVAVISMAPSSLSADTGSMENCLLEVIKDAKNDKTIGEIRKQCSESLNQSSIDHPLADSSENEKSNQDQADNSEDIDIPDEDPVAKRIELEEETELNPFVLTAHKPNYFLPLAYNFDRNEKPFRSEFDNGKMDSTEMKFQVSLKFPVWKGLYKGHGDVYVAYTNLSFWQAYNDNISSPFRETNHEPEIFLSFKNNWKFWGITNNLINVGVVHQSNGQSGSLSRSWNRVYANFVFQKDNFTISLKPWLRIIEDDNNDDNPDIEKYLGHGELRVGYKWGEHTLSSMFRHNFRSDTKGAIELGWSFPLLNRMRGYVQYFYGYGESLIDYNESTNRLSVGIALTDWM
ncbi:MAG: phospholipase A [Proteobacteria bacterium]|nr:phospholipase A [Pseudomonadota bacterium]